jgi:hypothetical protein
MATVAIHTTDAEHTIQTNDVGAAIIVETLSTAFGRAGGAWFPAEHEGPDMVGTASLRWLPAATTTILVTFEEGSVPPQLIDLPGFLKLT